MGQFSKRWNFNRNSKYANAAIVVSINHEKLFGDDLFGGIKFRRGLETKAFDMVQQHSKINRASKSKHDLHPPNP